MNRSLYISVILVLFTLNVFAQRVSTVVATVKNDKVLIGFQIRGLTCDQTITKVNFYVSRDGGVTYTGPLNFISGDLTNVRNGRHIVEWDALKEMPFSDEELVFDVRVEIEEKRRKRAIMLSYVGNVITPLGGRIGQLGKVSWYLEGRSSLLGGRTVSSEYIGNTIFNPDTPVDSVVFTGNEGYKSYSALIGATFQTSCNFFFYLGIGYGFRQYIREFENYDYATGQRTGTYWASEMDNTLEGVEMNGGIIYRYKALIFTGGITLVNMRNHFWTAGFGVAF